MCSKSLESLIRFIWRPVGAGIGDSLELIKVDTNIPPRLPMLTAFNYYYTDGGFSMKVLAFCLARNYFSLLHQWVSLCWLVCYLVRSGLMIIILVCSFCVNFSWVRRNKLTLTLELFSFSCERSSILSSSGLSFPSVYASTYDLLSFSEYFSFFVLISRTLTASFNSPSICVLFL